jgi:hypothetical protein
MIFRAKFGCQVNRWKWLGAMMKTGRTGNGCQFRYNQVIKKRGVWTHDKIRRVSGSKRSTKYLFSHQYHNKKAWKRIEKKALVWGMIRNCDLPTNVTKGGKRTYPMFEEIRKTFPTARTATAMEGYYRKGLNGRIPQYWPLKRIRVEGESKIGFKGLRYDHGEDEMIIACMLDRPRAKYGKPDKDRPGCVRVWERMSKVFWGRTPWGLYCRYKGHNTSSSHNRGKMNGYLAKVWPQTGSKSILNHANEQLRERLRVASRIAQAERERRKAAEQKERERLAAIAALNPPPPPPNPVKVKFTLKRE